MPKFTKPQEALIAKIAANGGSLLLTGKGELVTARKLLRNGVLKLVEWRTYAIVA